MLYAQKIEAIVSNSDIPEIPNGPITLLKYNKIGGHTIIYKYNQFLIKINDEHRTYEAIASNYPELATFLPKYYGLITMSVQNLEKKSEENVNHKHINSYNPLEIVNANENSNEHREAFNHQLAHEAREKTRVKHESKFQDMWRENEYIIMEDLTHDFINPFIIDLKLGTRQYGINLTPAKIESQKRKCAKSTSSSLGVRLCGLQTWEHNKPQILDKYYGRFLNQQEFMDNIVRFFRLSSGDDNDALFRCLILITEVMGLYVVVQKLNNFRFYGSSVLVAYDGVYENYQDLSYKGNDMKSYPLLDTDQGLHVSFEDLKSIYKLHIRLIDFSKTILDYKPLGVASKDYGFLKGLFNLFNYVKLIIEASGLKLDVGLPLCPSDGVESILNCQHKVDKLIQEIQKKPFRIPAISVQKFEYKFDELVSE